MRISSAMVEGVSELIRPTLASDPLLAKMVAGFHNGCITATELAEELACHPAVVRFHRLFLAQVAEKLAQSQCAVH